MWSLQKKFEQLEMYARIKKKFNIPSEYFRIEDKDIRNQKIL